MSWLRDPVCPNCEATVPLTDLWRAAPRTTRGIAISGAVGITCPHCAVRLRVQQHRLIGTSVAGYLLLLLIAGTARSWLPVDIGKIPEGVVITTIVVALVTFVLAVTRCAPRLLNLRRLRDGERLLYPLEVVPDEGPEPTPDDDDRAALAEVMNAPDQAPAPGKAWKCPKCGEESPGNFEACWKCEAARPESPTRGPEPS